MNLQFSNGDLIACIGDSNTSAEITDITYAQFLQYLYMTRYPQSNIRFVNCGIAGDAYISAINRMHWDIIPHVPTKAIIQLGTNDICSQQFPCLDKEDQVVAPEKIEKIYLDCVNLVNMLLQNNIHPTLILPGGFYEGYDHPRPENFRGANKALQKLAARIKKHYEDSNIAVIDLFPAFETICKEAPVDKITPDRTHYHTMIHLMMAMVIAEAQTFSPLVAEVRIGKSEKTYCCDIKELHMSENAISYTYTPHSLPFYDSEVYHQLEQYYPLNHRWNQELIFADALQPGYYQLMLNGKAAGCYTAEDFSKGVNIADNPENPNRELSKQLYDLLCTDWYKPMHDLRRLAYQIEHCLDLGIDVKRIPEYDTQNTHGAEPAFLKFAGEGYTTIIELFRNEESNKNKLAQLWGQALMVEKPKTYKIDIQKI